MPNVKTPKINVNPSDPNVNTYHGFVHLGWHAVTSLIIHQHLQGRMEYQAFKKIKINKDQSLNPIHFSITTAIYIKGMRYPTIGVIFQHFST